MQSNLPKVTSTLTHMNLDADKDAILNKSDIVLDKDAGVCEFHMNEDGFRLLAELLKKENDKNKKTIIEEREKAVEAEKKRLSDYYTVSTTKSRVEKLKTLVKVLDDKLNSMDIPSDVPVNNIKHNSVLGYETRQMINDIYSHVANKLLYYPPLKILDKQLHDAPSSILQTIDKYKIKTISFNDSNLTGDIHTKGYRLTHRNLTIKDAKIIKVKIQDKEYEVTWPSNTITPYSMKIKQKNMCISTPQQIS